MPRRYFVVLILILLIFGLGFFLIVRFISGPDEPKPGTSQQAPAQDFKKDTRSVTYTAQGRVVGEEEHRRVRIHVSPSERTIDLIEGYDESVVKTQTFANVQDAYDVFIASLKNLGYDSFNRQVTADERGFCPLGKRYVYEAELQNDSKLRSWSTSCGRKEGSFTGNASLVRRVFEAQIPEYKEFVKGSGLN